MLLIDEYKGLHREMYIMALAAFINCFADFATLFFSLYLTQMLSYSVAKAGLWVSAMYLSHIPGSLIGGKLCDSIGRKNIMVVSQIIMGACYIACGVFINSFFAPAFIVLGKFFDGITDPAREAFEADITTPEQRRAAFSLIYQVVNIACAINPFIASVLYKNYPRLLFISSGVLQLFSIAIVAVFTHEAFVKKEVSAKIKLKKKSALRELLKHPNLLLFSLGVFIFRFSYKQISFSLPLQLSGMFGENGASVFSRVLMINAVCVILFNPLVLKFSQKRNTVKNLVFAMFLFTVSFFLFAFAFSSLAFYVLALLYTAAELLFSNNDKVYRT